MAAAKKKKSTGPSTMGGSAKKAVKSPSKRDMAPTGTTRKPGGGPFRMGHKAT